MTALNLKECVFECFHPMDASLRDSAAPHVMQLWTDVNVATHFSIFLSLTPA